MDGLRRPDGRPPSAVERLTAVVMSSAFRWARRSGRQVTLSFSSFAAKAANPAATGDESKRLRLPQHPAGPAGQAGG
ncbi:MAG: hypothetical protein KatS3mg119_2335 [Rhodothalassiaceae bacterium]|nr:MAG: hypothetical protein KatS3mg119_2335 [Rhodothalassiaceae bacterium]